MGRPARLTIGALLLTIGGLLFLIRGQAVDKEFPLRIIPIFGVPGFLLLMSGLLPGRALSEQTRMVFSPVRLLTGLAISALGVAVVLVHLQGVHLPSEKLAVAGMLAVPAGLLYAATCWAQGCRYCGVLLEEYKARFNSDSAQLLEAAVGVGAVSEILALHRAEPGVHRLLLLIRYCPRCRKVGLLTGPHNTRGAIHNEQVGRLLDVLLASQRPDEVARGIF